ncbi:amidohydrolase [Streptomyces olivaceoviridis]|uniref:amidohydrolase family protein n=1 Tax=Streptomyces olivaceoviridis TaxID=1921 RepID=UPI0016791E80|nr:amidohydrolase family protein [Streptomyces olivaceoviridis]GGZ15229.1 amidohydrolase [Streptomyces olivaceoviridis]
MTTDPAEATDSVVRPPRVDAHHHVWDLSVRDQPWTRELPGLRRDFTLADLEPELDAHGIDATVVVETVDSADETVELLRLYARAGRVAGVVGWADLTTPDLAATLDRLRAAEGGTGLVGLRHQVQLEPPGAADGDWLLRRDVAVGLDVLGERGLVFDLIVTAAQLPSAIEAVRRHPGTSFVLDHAGKPPIAAGAVEPWAARMHELAALPNVAVKFSGLLTEAGDGQRDVAHLLPYAGPLLAEFGARRLMFGSDWPVCTLAADYGHTLSITAALLRTLDDAERAAVYGGTAIHWYGLAVGSGAVE